MKKNDAKPLEPKKMQKKLRENSRFQNVSVLVVGDAMLDRYWFGDASRLSPEAPVPVVRINRCEERLGGAANVARNAASIGANSTLLAVVGDDDAGKVILKLLEENNVNPCLHKDPHYSTIVKLRIIAQNQQLLRTDFETKIQSSALDYHESKFTSLLPSHDLIILSDYGKGGLDRISTIIKKGRELGKPILVDPKGTNYVQYKYATCITPNKSELAQVVGQWRDEKDLEVRAQNLREELKLEKLLLTRSEEGMTLFDENGSWTVPAQAREVFDVSGAGDTVISVLGVMLGAGYDWKTAVQISNRAGGIVVGKLGTASLTYEELFQES